MKTETTVHQHLSVFTYTKKKQKVSWSDTHLSFSGTPYMVVNQKSFDCQHGKDRNKSQKAKKSINK